MKSEITNRNATDITIKVKVDQSSLDPIVKRTLDFLRTRVKVAGFRPGKAPDHIVERELGSQSVQSEVLEAAVKDSYAAAVKQHSLPVIASPDINILKFVPYTELEYTAKVAVMPPVPAPDYTKVKAKRTVAEIKDDEIDRVVLDLQRRLAGRQAVDRAAKMGDEVNLDFEGSKDGQPVSGASSKSYDLILGSDSFIPGFEPQLVGLKTGDTKQFDITFPNDYQSTDLAGQTLTFKVKINQVNQTDLPPIDAKFAEQVSSHQSVDQLRADIRARIESEKADAAGRQFEGAVIDELLANTKFEVPAVLLNQERARLHADLEHRLAADGLDVAKYAKMQSKSIEQIDSDLKPEAEKRVRLAILLTEIAKAENLAVSLDDVEAELKRLRQLYPDPQMQTELNEPSTKEEIYNHLLASKTVARILEKVERPNHSI